MRRKLLLTSIIIPFILSILSINMIGVTAADTHDIAVVSVTPSQTSVKLGELVNITVVVENQGTEDETFDVTVYYGTNTIGTETVSSLAAGANASLTFTWDTTGIPYPYSGNFKIRAVASAVSGETDIADNSLVSLSLVRVFKSPYIAVVPHSTVDPDLTIGMNYTVSVYTDYNGDDVTGYQFTLEYNPLVLHGVKVTNGDLITNATNSGEARFVPGAFDNEAGELSLTVAFFFSVEEPVPLTSGPGILAYVTFTVVGTGDSGITLGTEAISSTSLFGYTDEGYGDVSTIVDAETPDSGHVLHGYFRNIVTEAIHDLAVISVASDKTEVEEGELLNITVVVENQGTVSEDVTLNVYYRHESGGAHWPIGTETVSSLAAGANTSLTFTWNTTDTVGVPAKYLLTAKVEPVSGETDTDDNTLPSEEMVTVRAKPEQPIPLELIVGAGAGVVVVIAYTHKYAARKYSVSET